MPFTLSNIFAQDTSWSIVTIPFMVTFVVFLAIYLCLRQRHKTVMMAYVVAFSLFFAWKASGVLMLLLPASAIASWLLTENIRQSKGRERRAWLTVAVIVEIAPLLYYKYTNFLIDILNDITQSNFSPLALILPVGISFYTFQTVSYSIDVYRRRFNLRATLPEYLFYITFFPLLMAGPITRAGTLIPQLRDIGRNGSADNDETLSDTLAYTGLWLIMLGMLKKVLIADYIAQYNDWIFDNPTGYSGFENLMGVFGYTLQIYCDFSGYSDMSMGLASLMGLRLRENFRSPYQSLNVTEFWHRWHIALSTWFRDYLYIPLGGNRCGKARTMLNNLVTMLVAGLWHGASMMFVIWGAMHGAALVVHKLCKSRLDNIEDTWYSRIASWTVTFIFLCTTWVFFRADSMDAACAVFRQIGTDFSISYLVPFVRTRPVWTLIVIAGFASHAIRQSSIGTLKEKFISSHWTVKLLIMLIVAQLAVNISQDSVRPFIYAQF